MPCEKTFQKIADHKEALKTGALVIRFDVDLSSDGLSGPGRGVAVINHSVATMIMKMREICAISGADPIRAPAHDIVSYREYEPEAGDSSSDDNYEKVPVDMSRIIVTKDHIHFEARLHGEFGHEIVGPEIEINDIVAHFPDLLTPEAVGGRIFAAA